MFRPLYKSVHQLILTTMPKATETDRMKVYTLWHDFHKTPAQISRQLKLQPSFVKRWIGCFKQGLPPTDKPRSGAPTKLIPQTLRQIRRHLKRKRGASTRKVADALQVEGTHISHETVRKAAKQLNLVPHRRFRKPRLTEAHKRARKKFVWGKQKFDWKRVMFSDEKKWGTFMAPGGKNDIIWTDNADDSLLIAETVSRPAKIQVWGGITWWGKTPLHFFDEELDQIIYRNILKKTMLPSAKALFRHDYPTNWIFQQDGDPAHTAKKTIQFLNSAVPVHWTKPKWPANSPDLSPIENMWSIMGPIVRKYNPTTTQQLKKAVKKAWDQVDLETIRSLYESMPHRIQQVREKQGGRIRY